MSIRNLDEKESRYGEVYIRLLQKQLERTDEYKKELFPVACVEKVREKYIELTKGYSNN